jgi:hypothetical protein
MASSGILGRVALVRTDVSKELSASFIKVTRIGELGTMLAVTSNRRTLRSVRRLLVTHTHTPPFHNTAVVDEEEISLLLSINYFPPLFQVSALA